MQSMIKAEKVSQTGSKVIEQVRNHSLKYLSDLDENKKKEERAIALELEKKQKEIEVILRKKKEEEHLKRLEFEEERIKEENERMKLAAEEKRKRDEEDERAQLLRDEWIQQEETKHQQYLEEQSKLGAVSPCISTIKINQEEDEYEIRRREDELIIQMGRKEAQREFEEKR